MQTCTQQAPNQPSINIKKVERHPHLSNRSGGFETHPSSIPMPEEEKEEGEKKKEREVKTPIPSLF